MIKLININSIFYTEEEILEDNINQKIMLKNLPYSYSHKLKSIFFTSLSSMDFIYYYPVKSKIRDLIYYKIRIKE